MKKIFIVVLIVFGINLSAFSQFRLQQPVYGGSACPPGSTSIDISDELIKVLFDQFRSEPVGKVLKAKCIIRFQAAVNPGYQIRQVLSKAKGFSHLPAGRNGKIELKIFSSTTVNSPLKVTKNFTAPTSQEFELAIELIANDQAWSACGASSLFLITEISSELTSATMAAESMISLDELDFQIQWRHCK